MRFLSAAVLTAAALVTTASADTLGIGDPAPNLTNTKWLQGNEFSHWQPGQVYVLDFWAPWCGPCIASMPHVNELHKEFKDKNVHIIGVSIWPRDGMTPTDEFIDTHVVDEEHNEKMLYNIAEDVDGATAKTFMESTGSNGIPTVMVIDQKGRLAWFGHPMDEDFDTSLRAVIAGSYDIEAKAAEMREQQALQAKAQPILAEANKAYSNADWDTVLAKLDQLIDIGYEVNNMTMTKIQMLATRANKPDEAWKNGWAFIKGPAADDAQALNALAWFIVDAEGVTNRDLELAYTAASRSNELTKNSDASIIDTLAHVEFARGNRDKAIQLEKKAVELAPARQKDELRKSLEKFEQGEPVGG